MRLRAPNAIKTSVLEGPFHENQAQQAGEEKRTIYISRANE